MLLIAAAVFCLVTPATVEPFVRGFFAVITIIGNLINLIEVFKLEKKRSLRFFIGLIVAIIMIGLGITMLMASKEVIEAMQQGIGIFLIVNSLINIWYILRLHFAAKRLKQNAKESYVLSDNQSV